MAVEAADLTYPVGEIRPEWFEGEDLTANLTLWITAGYIQADTADVVEVSDRNAIAEAYGYWRAYDAKAHALAATPNSVSLAGDLSVSGFTGQAKFFREKAEEWRGTFGTLLASAKAEESGVPRNVPLPSTSTAIKFRF